MTDAAFLFIAAAVVLVGGRPDPRVEKLFLEATKGGLY